MRGVDRADQMIGYYSLGRRSMKWWKRVFFYVVEICVFNAYVMFREHSPTNVKSRNNDYLAHRVDLIDQLIGDYSDEYTRVTRSPPTAPPEDSLNLTLGHFNSFSTDRKDCVVCEKRMHEKNLPRKDNRRKTNFKCEVCNVYLCSCNRAGGNCFKDYHTMVNYWT